MVDQDWALSNTLLGCLCKYCPDITTIALARFSSHCCLVSVIAVVQDTHDPVACTLVQPHLGGILVLELDWYPLRADKNEPLILCIAGADGSFRLLEVQK